MAAEFDAATPPYATSTKPDKSTFSAGMLFPWKDSLHQFEGFAHAHALEYSQPLIGASREWWNNVGSKRRTGQPSGFGV